MIGLNKRRDGCTQINRNKFSDFNIYFVSIYTALFAVMILFILKEFLINDVSLVRKGDAFGQHYKALIYFAGYIRDFLYNILINHKFAIPQFDFEIGLGSDVISTFAYYSFGDPFNYLSFLFTQDNMHWYYQFMIIFRMYCAGLSFSYLCFRMGNRNYYSVLAGAVTYCFSAYAIFAGFKHPYFLNPMVFLPIIVLAVENIIKGKSVILMAAIVAVAEISNFYFFYMLVLLTVIYVFARLITLYAKEIKKAVPPLLKIAASSLLGVGMGTILFLPVVITFMSDARTGTGHTLSLFYSIDAYRELPVGFITRAGSITWLIPCVSVLFIPSAAVMFSEKKKNLLLKTLIIMSVIFMCLPVAGKIFNGFSYVSNRWCFGYILVASYIITASWNSLIKAEKKHIIFISVFVSVLLVLCIICNSENNYEAIIPFLLLCLIIAILSYRYFNKGKIKYIFVQLVLLAFAVTSIFTYSYFIINQNHGDYVSDFAANKKFEDISYKSNEKIVEVIQNDNEKTNSFWRYTARELSDNSSFLDSIKSTQFYWSLSNGVISQFRADMNAGENLTYCYEGFDARTALNALASVKYFINTDKANQAIPFGYSKTKVEDVYKNEHHLPFGYTYESYITLDNLSRLSNSIEKQEIMLSSAVIENETELISQGSSETSCIDLKYAVKPADDVSFDNGSFVVTAIDAQIEFSFDAVKNSELYASFVGMSYTRTDPYELYGENTDVDPLNRYNMKDFDMLPDEEKEIILTDPLKVKQQGKATLKLSANSVDGEAFANSFYFYNPQANFYCGRKSFDINMGYTKNGMNKLVITFPYPGIYSFENFRIIAQPMKNYIDYTDKLKTDVLENVKFSYNTVNGTIKLNENKLLCMSVPYSKGWSAFVDGEKAELLKTNGMYCGLLLEKGEHTVELRYSTPGFKLGAIISALSIAIFLVLIYYNAQCKSFGSDKFRRKRIK